MEIDWRFGDEIISQLPQKSPHHLHLSFKIFPMNRTDIAELIFPDVKETIADLEQKYPPRVNPICSRIAPSPT